MENEFNSRFDVINGRFDSMKRDIDNRFDTINEGFDRIYRQINIQTRWMVGTMIALTGIVLAIVKLVI